MYDWENQRFFFTYNFYILMDKKLLLSLGVAFATVVSAFAADSFNCGQWTISINTESKVMDITHGETTFIKQGFVQYRNADGILVKSSDAVGVTVSEGEAISDLFGEGTKYTVYYDMGDQADIEQVFYAYDNHLEYFLTEAIVKSDVETKTNYISPLTSSTTTGVLSASGANNRVLSVPFSNDNWTRYRTLDLNGDVSSYYVTSIYEGDSRKGFVVGAVEFDTWKFVVRLEGTRNYGMRSIECACGCVTPDDVRAASSMQHGSIVGTDLRSSKVLVGYFDDWRRGMETYADAVATITPPRKSVVGNSFFGWNSWASLETEVNHDGVLDVIDFFKTEALPEFADNEGKVYIVLDSYYNWYMTPADLKDVARNCVRSGLVPGIYNTPFSDWNGYDGASEEEIGSYKMNGSDYTYGEAMLKWNGKKLKLDNGWALDPTHPGTKALIKYNIDEFKSWGYKYIKLDFLCNGILEADSWYDPNVHTGMQAYNEGLKYIAECCGDDFFIDYSIAPALPAQYANARRISCDAWGDISSSELVLNCMSYGWWLDRLYNFNDGDHAKFEGFSEGENRVRMMSEVMNGYVLLGDNFSLSGNRPGTEAIREQAKKVILNKEINEIARTCGATFWPVYGYNSKGGQGENYLMFDAGSVVYLTIINYGSDIMSGSIPVSDLGLEASNVDAVKELWSGTGYTLNSNGELEFSVPGKDVLAFKFDKVSGIDEVTGDTGKLVMYKAGDKLYVTAPHGLKSASVYGLDGSAVSMRRFAGDQMAEIALDNIDKGVYVVAVEEQGGSVHSYKFIK